MDGRHNDIMSALHRWRPTVYKMIDRKEDHGTYRSSGKEKDDPNNI